MRWVAQSAAALAFVLAIAEGSEEPDVTRPSVGSGSRSWTSADGSAGSSVTALTVLAAHG